MESAYWAAKTEHLAAKRADAEKKVIDQAAKLKKRKRAARVSLGGGGRTPRPKPPDPETMPMDDLKALVDQIGASGVGPE